MNSGENFGQFENPSTTFDEVINAPETQIERTQEQDKAVGEMNEKVVNIETTVEKGKHNKAVNTIKDKNLFELFLGNNKLKRGVTTGAAVMISSIFLAGCGNTTPDMASVGGGRPTPEFGGKTGYAYEHVVTTDNEVAGEKEQEKLSWGINVPALDEQIDEASEIGKSYYNTGCTRFEPEKKVSKNALGNLVPILEEIGEQRIQDERLAGNEDLALEYEEITRKITEVHNKEGRLTEEDFRELINEAPEQWTKDALKFEMLSQDISSVPLLHAAAEVDLDIEGIEVFKDIKDIQDGIAKIDGILSQEGGAEWLAQAISDIMDETDLDLSLGSGRFYHDYLAYTDSGDLIPENGLFYDSETVMVKLTVRNSENGAANAFVDRGICTNPLTEEGTTIIEFSAGDEDTSGIEGTDSASGENTDSAPGENTDSAPGENTDSAPGENTDSAPGENTDTGTENTDTGDEKTWGKEGDPHAQNPEIGHEVDVTDSVNPETEVSKETNESTNTGNQGYVDDGGAKPGAGSEQNGLNNNGFSDSGITATGATTENTERLQGNEKQGGDEMNGDNAYNPQNIINEGEKIDNQGNNAQQAAQTGGGNTSTTTGDTVTPPDNTSGNGDTGGAKPIVPGGDNFSDTDETDPNKW